MTPNLEDELRRVLADPPVPVAGGDGLAGTLAGLDRRVARVRARRRVAAGLSVAAVLTGGLAGATTLGGAGHPATDGQAVSGTYGGANAPAAPQGQAEARLSGPPPTRVVTAARNAVAEVTGGTVSGPVRWVRVGADYLVQIRFTAPVTCRYCHDPAASQYLVRGPVVEVRVPIEPVPAAAAPAPVPTPTGSGAGSDRSATAPTRTRLLPLNEATDLSRYGPVGEFALSPR